MSKGRIELLRTYPVLAKPRRQCADVLAYYTEDPDPGAPPIPRHYAVIRWVEDRKIDTLRVQHCDSCEDVDGVDVKTQMWNVVPTKDTNGIIHSSRETAERMCEHFNLQFERLEKMRLWKDSLGFSGCILEFEVKEEWQ